MTDSLAAVATQGVTVPSGSTSDDLPDLIAQITGGGGGVVISDTADEHGGTIRTITATELRTQAKTGIMPSASAQTVLPDSGYNALSSVQINAMPAGSAGTPLAEKGPVSNHSVSVTPSVTNTAGYISGGTKRGTAVTVTASELVSGNRAITENGTGIDVADYATVSVNVSGGSGMNVQSYIGNWNTSQSSYTASTLQLTVAKTGTYRVTWTGFRNTTSGTSGSQLYRTRNGTTTAVGSANTAFSLTNYGQRVELTGQQFQAGDILTVYARARNTSYMMYVANLIIEQTA